MSKLRLCLINDGTFRIYEEKGKYVKFENEDDLKKYIEKNKNNFNVCFLSEEVYS